MQSKDPLKPSLFESKSEEKNYDSFISNLEANQNKKYEGLAEWNSRLKAPQLYDLAPARTMEQKRPPLGMNPALHHNIKVFRVTKRNLSARYMATHARSQCIIGFLDKYNGQYYLIAAKETQDKSIEDLKKDIIPQYKAYIEDILSKNHVAFSINLISFYLEEALNLNKSYSWKIKLIDPNQSTPYVEGQLCAHILSAVGVCTGKYKEHFYSLCSDKMPSYDDLFLKKPPARNILVPTFNVEDPDLPAKLKASGASSHGFWNCKGFVDIKTRNFYLIKSIFDENFLAIFQHNLEQRTGASLVSFSMYGRKNLRHFDALKRGHNKVFSSIIDHIDVAIDVAEGLCLTYSPFDIAYLSKITQHRAAKMEAEKLLRKPIIDIQAFFDFKIQNFHVEVETIDALSDFIHNNQIGFKLPEAHIIAGFLNKYTGDFCIFDGSEVVNEASGSLAEDKMRAYQNKLEFEYYQNTKLIGFLFHLNAPKPRPISTCLFQAEQLTPCVARLLNHIQDSLKSALRLHDAPYQPLDFYIEPYDDLFLKTMHYGRKENQVKTLNVQNTNLPQEIKDHFQTEHIFNDYMGFLNKQTGDFYLFAAELSESAVHLQKNLETQVGAVLLPFHSRADKSLAVGFISSRQAVDGSLTERLLTSIHRAIQLARNENELGAKPYMAFKFFSKPVAVPQVAVVLHLPQDDFNGLEGETPNALVETKPSH